MDVLQLLKADHESLRSLLAEVDSAKSLATKRDLANRFGDTLLAHLKAESDYLYPELAGLFGGAQALVTICQANHLILTRAWQQVEKIISKPIALQVGLGKKISELNTALTNHLALQEQSVLPKLREGMPTQEREDLGQVFLDFKDEVVTHGIHALLQSSERAAKFSGEAKKAGQKAAASQRA